MTPFPVGAGDGEGASGEAVGKEKSGEEGKNGRFVFESGHRGALVLLDTRTGRTWVLPDDAEDLSWKAMGGAVAAPPEWSPRSPVEVLQKGYPLAVSALFGQLGRKTGPGDLQTAFIEYRGRGWACRFSSENQKWACEETR